MTDFDRPIHRWTALAVLVAFATPPVALVWLSGTGVSIPGQLAVGATLLPLIVVTLILGPVARRVASSPDEPELVDRQLSEALGTTSEEYEELLDE